MKNYLFDKMNGCYIYYCARRDAINHVSTMRKYGLAALTTIATLGATDKMQSQVVENNPNRPEGKEVFFNVDYHFNQAANDIYTEEYKKEEIQKHLEVFREGLLSSNSLKHIFASANILDIDLVGTGTPSDLGNFSNYVYNISDNTESRNLQVCVFGEEGYSERTSAGPTATPEDYSTGVISESFDHEDILSHMVGHMFGVNANHDGTIRNATAHVDYEHGNGYEEVSNMSSLGANGRGVFYSTDPSDVNTDKIDENGNFLLQSKFERPAYINPTEMDSGELNTSTKIETNATNLERIHFRDAPPLKTPIIEFDENNKITINNAEEVNANEFLSINGDASNSLQYTDLDICVYEEGATQNDAYVLRLKIGEPIPNGSLENGKRYVVKAYSHDTNQVSTISNALQYQSLGVENEDLVQTKMYPNPTSETLFIKSEANVESVEIFNMLGQKMVVVNSRDAINRVSTNNNTPNNNATKNTQINISQYPTGTYFVKIKTNKGTTTQKIIIKR